MPFVKADIKQEIEEMKKNDRDFAKAYNVIEEEYRLIEEAINLRKNIGISQCKVAEETGLTQQMVSRIEKVGNSPTLRNFLRYLDGIGLEIKIKKKASLG
ncbi:helix-turn-helix domain-containing protein [Paramaledivibacter caminithermalis]|jgi:DNA-binding phage protein|uniref:Helix-turn-helix domain-containing protein n=1 Tax=Paramaledivibacter caminithermalis (strain DSM 15212 / CIP 107654 / DViRD3) TaxID=1121301 RepID=A0A1M6K3S9_PARC5|nr:helix-turn-helix transcriptional regulator [Paramaledivibacter caminithermalis]SHJ53569.1 Helix-turn-helix domain-containing protein [Paramaledivibacter caminithermalis DSM 15212]